MRNLRKVRVAISVSLAPEIREAIERAAEREHLPVSRSLERLIREALEARARRRQPEPTVTP